MFDFLIFFSTSYLYL
jgi:hypothetical protein